MYTALSAIALAGSVLTQPTPAPVPGSGYLNNRALTESLGSIASMNQRAWVSTIGTSRDGSRIELVTLGADPASADDRPALLITAGIDGRYLVGTEMATRIAQRILADHADLLDTMTIYIIPRVNPDGAGRNFVALSMGTVGTSQRVDEDRDRAIDEDGPEDLNGDGMITMMRRLHPSIQDPPTHLADPDDPRLNIKPDAEKGQVASFTLYTEGIDNDGDGQINEDGFGSVDLDMNFMHGWPEYNPHAGRYPLSEPEANAIARFVLDHDNIVMALTLGRHDNLINLPDSKSKDLSGSAPKAIDAEDAGIYKLVSELYKDTTGSKSAPSEEIAGSFHAWLYAQRGIPSFAVVPWSRPEPESAEKAGDEGDDNEAKPDPEPEGDASGLTPSGIGDISQETLEELRDFYENMTGEKVDESMAASLTPEMVEGFAAQAGIEIKRIKPAEAEDTPGDTKKAKKSEKSEDAKWLEYFDGSGIDGFVDWQPYEHPTLGAVEIGGFMPLARINPPVDQLDSLAEKLTEFVVKLTETRPAVTVVGPEVSELADGLYEMRLALVNNGRLPTSTAYSQSKRTIRPIVVRISPLVDDILTGNRVNKSWGISADGGRVEYHWIFRSDDLSTETIEIIDPRLGNHTLQIGAQP